MSKLLLFVVVLLEFNYVFCEEQFYTSKFDSIDYRSILQSDRLLKNYYNCLMDKGPCTPDGKELKIVIPDALQTECAKCSEKQKAAGKEIVDYIIKNKPNMWKDLSEKYDPEGIYKSKYKDKWLEMGYSLK